MNKENLKKWIDALESEEYTQGSGALRNADGYCCLGVACDVYRKETGNGSWQYVLGMSKDLYTFIYRDSDLSDLPTEVSEWLDAKACNPILFVEGEAEIDCIHANDEYGMNFKEIAAKLRETYLSEEQ